MHTDLEFLTQDDLISFEGEAGAAAGEGVLEAAGLPDEGAKWEVKFALAHNKWFRADASERAEGQSSVFLRFFRVVVPAITDLARR